MIQDLLSKYLSFIVLLGAILSLGLALPVIDSSRQNSAPPVDSVYLRVDPEKIVLAPNDDRVPCGECHALEYDTWQSTSHATGFDDMHRSQQAQRILDRMDIQLAKRESLCLKCHYTPKIMEDEVRAIAGVSCESCHGAGKDWVNLHYDYGGATHDTESAAHKQQRIEASAGGGMLRPSDNMYGVAANCFACHAVPSEELINRGRHPGGSRFELVEWTEDIRHNFLQAQWSTNTANRENSPDRKRQLYVIGRLLDYEYSLRGAALATTPGHFFTAMQRRVATSVRELERIAQVTPIYEINNILRLNEDVEVALHNEAALIRTAENVRVLGQRLGTRNTFAGWEALDSLIESSSRSNVADLETPALRQASDLVTPTGVAGEKMQKPDWFPVEEYEVIAPGCNCHAMPSDWLFDDTHSRSAEPILNNSIRALEIASSYGLTSSEMKKGNQICMQCHGTIEAGAEDWPVIEGIGCESCHGPSSGYFDPHKSGMGYEYGMKNLDNAEVRAENCARCHHVTDERLLSSGHPSGRNFNMEARNNRIRHWPDSDMPTHTELEGDVLLDAYKAIKRLRPIPDVVVATPPVLSSNERRVIDRSRGGWSIIVASEKQQQDAERVAARFASIFGAQEMPIEVLATSTNNIVRYRVCVGQFVSKEEALLFIRRSGAIFPDDVWLLEIESG